MSTVDIQLPEALRSYLHEESARRGYENASEFVQALLEAERMRDLRKELEGMLLEAIDGPSTEWTSSDVDDIERVGKRLIERRRNAR